MFHHVSLPLHLQKWCEILNGSAAATLKILSHPGEQTELQVYIDTLCVCVASLNILSPAFFRLFFFFVTCTLSIMSRVQKAQQGDVAHFPRKFVSRQRTWTSDLCVGEQLSPGAPQATIIVKGEEDDDEAVCSQRGERWERREGKRERREGRGKLWGRDCLALKCIIVELSSEPQLGRPWVSTINLYAHWYYT